MRNLTCFFLLWMTGNALAQSPTIDFKYGLKLSNLSAVQPQQTYHRNASGTLYAVTNAQTFDALQLIPAFMWQTKKGDFAELSIPRWQLQRVAATRTDSTGVGATGVDHHINLGLQYTYNIRFLKKKESKWLPMLGFGIMPFFAKTHLEPLDDTQFAVDDWKTGLQATLHPHVMWMPSSRIFLDMGLMLTAFEFSFAAHYDSDPRLPLQEGYTVNWNAANGHNGIQIGAGIKL